MPLRELVVSVVVGLLLLSSLSHAWIPPPALVHTAIGAVAGSAGAITAYPIDFVKSQLQTPEGREKYKNGGLQAAYDIVKNEGPLGLYRGALINVVGVAPEKTIKLSVNDVMRAVLLSHFGGSLSIGSEVVAGGIAGMTQVIVTQPLELIKTRLQTSKMSMQEVVSQIKSVRDLYEGAEACVARDMMFSAILFPLYAHGKIVLASGILFVLAGHDGNVIVDQGTVTFWANLLAGTLAAAPAALLSTPADVCKTRIQAAKSSSSTTTTSNTPLVPAMAMDYTSTGTSQSLVGVFQSIVENEGPEVLFSGWLERVVRSAPQFGVTLAMFDVLTSWAIQHHYLLPAAETGI